MAKPDRNELLADLALMGSRGRAEGEDPKRFPRTFYVVPEHIRAFDPDVVLIVGPRGAGKTELFRAVIDLKLLPAMARHVPQLRLPPLDSTRWVAAYPIESEFPDALGLERFFHQHGSRASAGLELWFAYLVRVLYRELDAEGQRAVADLIRQPGGDADRNYGIFQSLGNAPLLALDRLDARLEQEKRYIFVGYDELETLGSVGWQTMSRAVAGLVAFWASYTRRWRRIRSKLFLRTDLFERQTTAGVADLAKLAANRADISWSDRHLYGMLIKRIANSSDALFDYCLKSKVPFAPDDPQLGHMPAIRRVEDARPLVERMIGKFMGANVKKGLTYRWLLAHIRDGRGQALPRPLVRVVERAAELQRSSANTPDWPRLLDPASLRRALDHVSREHVGYARNEWPWLPKLEEILSGEHVPWDRQQIDVLLNNSWRRLTKGTPDLPVKTPRDLVDYLLEIGAFRSRSDGRIDVPDLFLAGLGLKRKGGVRMN